MVYNKKEIMDIVARVLGDNATGVYIHEDVVRRDIGYDDADLVSTIGDNPWYINNIDDFEIMYGMTKLCIYPLSKKIPWVIKIPITGVYCHAEDEDEEYIDDSIANKVGMAERNVCDEEISIYENSSSDIQAIMIKNYYVGEYNNIPIYIQEKVYECDGDCGQHSKYGYLPNILINEINFLMDINSDINDEDFVYNVILSYGIMKAVEIFNELDDIDDLHSKNYGYNSKGEAVIFDYAGYDFGQYSFDVA